MTGPKWPFVVVNVRTTGSQYQVLKYMKSDILIILALAAITNLKIIFYH